MCGISGYINLDNKSLKNSAHIRNMLLAQKHRGPDDSGICAFNLSSGSFIELDVNESINVDDKFNAVLGFNRLSILDLTSNGHQPMISPEGKVIMAMNGEIYNAFDFKDELIKKKYTFKSNTDTEIALHLYSEYGIVGMLERLNGMFAFAIVDLNLRKLFLARDRFGIKPLYLFQENGLLAFSSEMKSFKAIPGFKFQLDHSGLSEFLLFRNLINNTLFKNIVNIEPGHYLEINNTGKTILSQYYDIRTEGIQKKPDTLEAFAAETLKLSLQKAVERQMISDVKLGCQLSGGVDSSLVTAYATKLVKKGSLETISIVFDNPRFSEKKYIDKVVEKLHLQSHQFTLTATDYMNMLEEATWHFEQPLNHPNTIGIKLLSREAKKHVTVLLSGEGADEALAGYSRFLPSNQNAWTRSFWSGLKKNRFNLFLFFSYWFDKDKRYLMQTAFGSVSVASKIYPSFSLPLALNQRNLIWKMVQVNNQQNRRKYELLTYLPDLLMRQDKMSMAHSIENRVPFLDHEMVSASLLLDDKLLIKKKNGQYEGKMLLKELCADEFDDCFAFRNKMGFGIPLADFFASDSFQEKWNTILLPGMKKRKLFHVQTVQNWAKKPHNLSPDQLDAIWLMSGFEIWAQQYLDQ